MQARGGDLQQHVGDFRQDVAVIGTQPGHLQRYVPQHCRSRVFREDLGDRQHKTRKDDPKVVARYAMHALVDGVNHSLGPPWASGYMTEQCLQRHLSLPTPRFFSPMWITGRNCIGSQHFSGARAPPGTR